MNGNNGPKRNAQENSLEKLLQNLSSDENGLTTEEATKRLERTGPNEIPEKKANPLRKFFQYFWGPIPWMIEGAAIMSVVIHHMEDFYIIFSLLLMNAVVGFWQEHKAENAIELLKQKLSLTAKVLRDGNWLQIPARNLVPGDVIRIRLGDIVPADSKLIKGEYVQVDESTLTGESLPVEKHLTDEVYAGSVISRGEMDAMVCATGIHTYFGKTTKLIEEAKTQSHFQKAIVKIGDYLITLAAILVSIIFLVSLYRHESLPHTIQYALVLTVAAIPAALPAVLSVTMAIGAVVLARKEAIVNKLVSIEEMAGMDVLCSDKTGTITKNELTIGEVKVFNNFTEEELLFYGELASREEDKDPIDTAIIKKSREMPQVHKNYSVMTFSPFDPVSKRTEALIEETTGLTYKVTKGAPQVILELIAQKDSLANQVNTVVNEFAARGYRALGIAKTGDQGIWHLVGLISLYDPAREDSAKTIETAQSMGVQVKMVTGDHTAIAKEIAQQVHLGTNIIPASSFLNSSDREARRLIENADGFSQVFPEHKYHIIESLQDGGHIVGMTGDGVNDAPALKKADVGIAVAGATDAAKSAADIVFTKPGLSVIIDAIQESRKIFQRMTNYSIYRIAETIRVILFITLSIIVFQFYPVTALMIVLLALLNDFPIMTIAYDNVIYSGKPERWNIRTILGIATFLGIIGIISSFGMFYIGYDMLHLSREVLQSFIYLKLSVAGHLTVFLARTKGHFWTIKPAKALLFAVLITQLIATLITVYGILLPAMGWGLAMLVWSYALCFFLLTDFLKVQFYKLLDHSGLKFHR